jgi:large subunit ribosomal protein L19
MSQHPLIKAIEASFQRSGLPDFRSGDSVRVHTLIKEGDKERVQVFEGVVIDRRRGGARASFTVRKVSYGVGVERIFPLHTSRIEKVELVQKGRVRRARLNYLRQLQGRAARIKGERIIEDSASVKAAKAAEAVKAAKAAEAVKAAKAEGAKAEGAA